MIGWSGIIEWVILWDILNRNGEIILISGKLEVIMRLFLFRWFGIMIFGNGEFLMEFIN